MTLENWTATNCDKTFDPYKIKTRISTVDSSKNTFSIRVNFSDNCSIDFEPKIEFNDGILNLIPYSKNKNSFANCNCCFSIQYTIDGLKGKNFQTYFKGKKVEYSPFPFDTFPITSILYKGKMVNKKNKFGFKEGLWIYFYETDTIDIMEFYPEPTLMGESIPSWEKSFYPNGKMSSYRTNDTMQGWFEDGSLHYLKYPYMVGDTIFTSSKINYENKKIKETSLKKSYPIKDKDSTRVSNKKTRWITKQVFNLSFYKNGQLEREITNDTAYYWYKNGQLKLKHYDSGSTKYDTLGNIIERDVEWTSFSENGIFKLDHKLHILYYGNKRPKEISFTRQEVNNMLIDKLKYFWAWDIEGNLIQSPKNWDEDLPWKEYLEE